jgi:hypothetical protein
LAANDDLIGIDGQYITFAVESGRNIYAGPFQCLTNLRAIELANKDRASPASTPAQIELRRIASVSYKVVNCKLIVAGTRIRQSNAHITQLKPVLSKSQHARLWNYLH